MDRRDFWWQSPLRKQQFGWFDNCVTKRKADCVAIVKIILLLRDAELLVAGGDDSELLDAAVQSAEFHADMLGSLARIGIEPQSLPQDDGLKAVQFGPQILALEDGRMFAGFDELSRQVLQENFPTLGSGSRINQNIFKLADVARPGVTEKELQNRC